MVTAACWSRFSKLEQHRLWTSWPESNSYCRGWEEYLEIFDAFYADEVEVTADTETDPIRGKERIRALLFNFLAPLHVMVEIGGLAIHVRESLIHGDAADETHSAWSVNLIGVSGRTCALNWCTLRRWADSRVVYERHYDTSKAVGPSPPTTLV
jgi:hypothetical protein